MPQFDLRGIKVAKYVNTAGVITYTDVQSAGDAMTANLELRFAEGRLYAESTLAEFIRKCVGGTISLGVKYIPTAAQKLMFGTKENSRSITFVNSSGTTTTATVKSLVTGKKTNGAYVGVAFYAPDMVDGVEKYTCVLIKRAMFGQPAMALQTAGESIVFNTPTTSGEFMADNSIDGNLTEVAVCDDENEAIAWVAAVLA